MGQHRDWSQYTKIGSLHFNFNYIDSNYQQGQPNDCWLWTGPTHRQGYGMCGGIDANNNNFMTVMHRPIMMRHLGRALASNEFVIKTCSEHRCCNPAHYTLGTHQEKVDNMIANGRRRQGHKTAGVSKKQNRNYKYSEADIKWLRDASTQEIADRYNTTLIHAGQIRWGVRRGFRWLAWPNDPRLKGTDNE